MILFAYDIVIFTTNPTSLQSQIDNIYHYSEQWGLKINVNKTKVCIFEKRKRPHNLEFYIGDEKLEIVNNFTYLGINFTHTGNFKNAVNVLSDQALRAYHNLLYIFDKLDCKIQMKLELFDKMITQISLYGSEVWGIYCIKEIDKLHIKFCKYVLGVKTQTPNFAVYGELGRFPLYIKAIERSLKYWLKIRNCNSLTQSMYVDQITDPFSDCWTDYIFRTISRLGYGYLIDNLLVDKDVILSNLKRRLRDQFIQEWNQNISASPKVYHFHKFKDVFQYEEYLNIIKSDHLRQLLTSFRLGSHKLEIEIGRINNVGRDNRICKMCNMNVIESEFHFIMCCPKYRSIRLKCFGNIAWPTLEKFKSLRSTKRKNLIIQLSNYIKEAFSLRRNVLDIM